MNIENESVATKLIRLNVGRVYDSVHMHIRKLSSNNIHIAVGYNTVNDSIISVCNSIRDNLREEIKEYEY